MESYETFSTQCIVFPLFYSLNSIWHISGFPHRFIHTLCIPVIDSKVIRLSFWQHWNLYIQMQPIILKMKAYFHIIAIFKLLRFHYFGNFCFLIPSRVLSFAPQSGIDFLKELKVVGRQVRQMTQLRNINCGKTWTENMSNPAWGVPISYCSNLFHKEVFIFILI